MDTMVCCQLGWAGVFPFLPQGTFGLSNIAKHLLAGYDLEKETRKEFIGMKLEDGFSCQQIEYAVKDSLITHKLVWPIYKRLHNQGLWELWENVEKPLIEILVRTELKGVKINTKEVERLLLVKEAELADTYARILSHIATIPAHKVPKFPKGIFNPGSSQQNVSILSAVGIKVLDTKASTLETTLANHPIDLLVDIIKWKKTKTIISKFLTKWLEEHIDPKTSCIYTSFGTCSTETGRMSCKEPNLQQVPKELRSMIVARENHQILSLDFSQFEFRAAAAATEEEYLVEAFVERARLLPQIKSLALSYGYDDPDAFEKAITKSLVTVASTEGKLMDSFIATDIHRRNAALILGKDITQITSKDRSIGKCTSLDSYVHTNKGIFTLRELLPKKLTKDTYYDLKGIKVLTDTGYESAPTLYYYGKSPALRITTLSGRSLVCTGVHRFRTLDKQGKYVWIKADKLKVGHSVLAKFDAPYSGKLTKFPLEMKTLEQYVAFAELIGLTLLEGTINKDTIVYPGARDARVRDLLTRTGYTKTKINGPTKMNNTITVFRADIAKWLGTTSSIPKSFLHDCEERAIVGLLRGLASTNNLGISFDTLPMNILHTIQNLLLRLGINAYLIPEKHCAKGVPSLFLYDYNQKLLNYLFGNESIKPVMNEIHALKYSGSTRTHMKLVEAGFFGWPAHEKLIDAQRLLVEEALTEEERSTIQFLIDNNLRKETIVSITPVAECEVGDFTVPSTSTVVYEGFVTHNTLGYAVLYGAGASRVQESLAKEGFYHSIKECKAFLDDFFRYLPKVEYFIKETHAKVLSPGYITTCMGRKRFFKLPYAYQTRKYATESEAAFREATNFCFQGANADATKKAMILIDMAFREYPEAVRPTLLLSVHDEIVSEVHNSNVEEVAQLSEKIMIECGQEALEYKIPIECSRAIAPHWSK
jgi:DNA polymerase I-like protein with 3'-5' exonuclease and polymerase domains